MIRKLLLYTCLFPIFTGCGAKKEQKEPARPQTLFGIYNSRVAGMRPVELHEDSTITYVRPVAGGEMPVNQNGRFSYRNDSLFIQWANGTVGKSKFLKKKDRFIFYIGTTRYEKK